MYTGAYLEKVHKVVPADTFGEIHNVVTEALDGETKQRAHRVLGLLDFWKK